VLREFATLSDDDFAQLMDAVRNADDIRLPQDKISKLKKQFGEAGKSVQVILVFAGNILGHLYESDDFESEKNEFLEVLKSFISDEIDDEKEANLIIYRMSELLQPWSDSDARRKREWLEKGILPSATEFASFVDLRPSFTSDSGLDRFGGAIYTLVILLIVLGVPKLFGFTLLSLVKGIREEMAHLIALRWNVKSIDALAIISVVFAGIVFGFLLRMTTLGQQASVAGPPDHSLLILSSLVIVVLTIVTVASLYALRAIDRPR